MRYIFVIVLFVISSCSNSAAKKKIDVGQLIEENNYRTITVDSLFQISFPERFTKTAHLSEDAILQFNDLSSEEHLIVLNESNDSIAVTLKDKMSQVFNVKELTNGRTSISVNSEMSIENYSCDVLSASQIGEYSYWLTRFKWSSKSYIVCRWTLKRKKEQFTKDAKLIEKTFVLFRYEN